jgi:hypothetical protein
MDIMPGANRHLALSEFPDKTELPKGGCVLSFPPAVVRFERFRDVDRRLGIRWKRNVHRVRKVFVHEPVDLVFAESFPKVVKIGEIRADKAPGTVAAQGLLVEP